MNKIEKIKNLKNEMHQLLEDMSEKSVELLKYYDLTTFDMWDAINDLAGASVNNSMFDLIKWVLTDNDARDIVDAIIEHKNHYHFTSLSELLEMAQYNQYIQEMKKDVEKIELYIERQELVKYLESEGVNG